MTRCVCLALLVCAGCQGTFGRVPPRPPALAVAEPAREAAPAPMQPFQPPAADATEEHLNRAVALLEKGQDAEALPHLQRYVAERPDQLLARANLGELLFRQKKLTESRLQFELFVGMAQEQGEQAFRYLIHCHSRLVEISEEQENAYDEHLNRGIGLYLLACKRATEPDSTGDYSVDSLMLKAAAELREARAEKPDEARPSYYLYQIFTQLGQHTAAQRALADADARILLGRLTPLERRELQMASLREAGANISRQSR
jgi:hypothetical protein